MRSRFPRSYSLDRSVRESLQKHIEQATVEQLQLPIDDWAEFLRACPNPLLRSALFNVSSRSKMVRDHPIPAQSTYSIKYTGATLNQFHLDVLVEIFHLFRGKDFRRPVAVTLYKFLKGLGLTDSGKNRKAVRSRIKDLTHGGFEINPNVKGDAALITGSFLVNTLSSPASSRQNKLVFVINPPVRRLFFDDVTWLHADDRRSFGRNQMAKWIHGIVFSHATWYPTYVETLWTLSGAECSKKKFRETLLEALRVLDAAKLITRVPGSSGYIDADDKLRLAKVRPTKNGLTSRTSSKRTSRSAEVEIPQSSERSYITI